MPKLLNRLPKYRRHKASGQAVVVIGGQTHYLGTHNSAASKAEYDRLTGAWIASGKPTGGLPKPAQADQVTVSEVILRYIEYAEGYYGNDASGVIQLGHLRAASRILKQLYGNTAAREFGPLALQVVRDGFIAAGWNRTYCNQQTLRVRRIFRWAVEQEIVPPTDKVRALDALKGLKKGKSEAPEPVPVRPVSDLHLEAAADKASPPVAAMMRLQRLTGMRPGEVCMMRTADIDRKEKPWRYIPQSHKTQGHGVERVIYLGPKAIELVKPFLTLKPDQYLFRPSEAVKWTRAKRKAARTTPKTYGNSAGTNKKRKPAKQPGDLYSVHSYRQAIESACDSAFPLPGALAPIDLPKHRKGTKRESLAKWKARLSASELEAVEKWRKDHRFHPHQIRHTAATELRRKHGLEAAQVLLGHRQLSATQIYAERDVEAAQKIATAEG